MTRSADTTVLDNAKKQAEKQIKTRLREEGESLLSRSIPRIEKALQEGDVREFIFLMNDIIVEFAEQARNAAGFDVVKLIQMAASGWLANTATDGAGIEDLDINGTKIPMKLVSTFVLACMINQAINFAKAEMSRYVVEQRQQKALEMHAPRGAQTSLTAKVHDDQSDLLKVIFASSEQMVEEDFRDEHINLDAQDGYKGYVFFDDDDDILSISILSVNPQTKLPEGSPDVLSKISQIDSLIESLQGDNNGLLTIALHSIRNRYVRLVNNLPSTTQDITDKTAQIETHYHKLLFSLQAKLKESEAESISDTSSLAEVIGNAISSKSASKEPVVQRVVAGVIRSKTANNPFDKLVEESFDVALPKEKEHITEFEATADITKPQYMRNLANVPSSKGPMGWLATMGLTALDNLDATVAGLDLIRDTAMGESGSDTKQEFNDAIDGLVDNLVKSFEKKGWAQYLVVGFAKLVTDFDKAKSDAATGIKSALTEISKRLLQNMEKSNHAFSNQPILTRAFFPADFWGEVLQSTFGRGMVPSLGGTPPLFQLPDDPLAIMAKPFDEQNEQVKVVLTFITNLSKRKEQLLTDTDIKVFQWKQCLANVFLDLMSKKLSDEKFNTAAPKAKKALSRAINGIADLDASDSDLVTLRAILKNTAQTINGEEPKIGLYALKKSMTITNQHIGAASKATLSFEELQKQLANLTDVPIHHHADVQKATLKLEEIARLNIELTNEEHKNAKGGMFETLSNLGRGVTRALTRRLSSTSGSESDDDNAHPEADHLAQAQEKSLKRTEELNQKIHSLMEEVNDIYRSIEFPTSSRLDHLPAQTDELFHINALPKDAYTKTPAMMIGGFSALTAVTATAIAVTPLLCTAFAAASFVLPVVVTILSVICALALAFVVVTAVKKIKHNLKYSDEGKAKRATINNLLSATVAASKRIAHDQLLHCTPVERYSELNGSPAVSNIDKVFNSKELIANPYGQIASDASTHRSAGLYPAYTNSTKHLAGTLKSALNSLKQKARRIVNTIESVQQKLNELHHHLNPANQTEQDIVTKHKKNLTSKLTQCIKDLKQARDLAKQEAKNTVEGSPESVSLNLVNQILKQLTDALKQSRTCSSQDDSQLIISALENAYTDAVGLRESATECGGKFAREAVYSFVRIMLANNKQSHPLLSKYESIPLIHRHHAIAQIIAEEADVMPKADLAEIIHQAGDAYRTEWQKQDPASARRKYINNARQYEFYPARVAQQDGIPVPPSTDGAPGF